MPNTFINRARRALNVFAGREPLYREISSGYSYRPDRYRMSRGNERSIINAAYTRMAVDIAAIDIRQVTLDENLRYRQDSTTGLNRCLTLEANIDQTARALRIDGVISMFDEGVVAIVPVDYDIHPPTAEDPQSRIDIYSLRVGKIIEWYPTKVKVDLYDERNGLHKEVIVDKRHTAIIDNPFYSIMNEPNSTLQRLIRKLNLLDAIDEQSGSGKLDLIIQLPYTVRTESRKRQAEERRNSLEEQLSGSKYGIAYADATEHITQLNRPVENNLMHQIEFLTSMLFSQLGVSQPVLDGTADPNVMMNYNNRIMETILTAFVDEFNRSWLTDVQRDKEGQKIMYFRDPFKLVPVETLADMADRFTRNEILSSNEFRQIIGIKPSSDPRADELRNKNISDPRSKLQTEKSKEDNEDTDEPTESE